MTILIVKDLQSLNTVKEELLKAGIAEENISILHRDPEVTTNTTGADDIGTPDATESAMQGAEVGVSQGAKIGGVIGAALGGLALIATGPVSLPLLIGGAVVSGMIGAGTGSVTGGIAGAINGIDASTLGEENAKLTEEHRLKAQQVIEQGGALIHIDDGIGTDASVNEIVERTGAEKL